MIIGVKVAALASLMAGAGLSAAFAQDAGAPPPPAEPPARCGGLLCDMGMFDHQDAFGASSAACGVFCRLTGGGPAADAAAAQQAQAAQAQQEAAPPPVEPPKPHHKRKHVAKAAPTIPPAEPAATKTN